MAEFKYTTTKQLQPRPGTTFATTYYKQTESERERLKQHITTVSRQFALLAQHDPEAAAWLQQPLRGYRKSTAGEYYSAGEIITDMVRQFEQKKDVPSGMLGRWQKLFKNTEFDICLVPAQRRPDTTYGQLFEND